ncbi:MAG: LysM peptidoglycan-binding domain-containing protein [Acidobacteriota bacterium]|nr:LysM peptidoglycan-binding domain-containing protein [Acidobacteriota bacterium]
MTKHNDNQGSAEWNCTMAWDRSRQRLHASAVLLAICAFSASAPVWAQDVAEAARQEQARKDKQAAARQKHVYTEEDLKRARILTREDRELLDAKKREQGAPGTAPPPAEVSADALELLPLGDVARMYRAMKELSQAAQSAEFHLPASNTANAELASPRPLREFAMPKPRVARSSRHLAPVAPEFSNVAVVAPVLEPAGVAPQPAHEFAMLRPNAVLPTAIAVPVAPVLVDAAAPRTIIVKRGDSFWKLAQVNLGDGHRWHEILAVNPSIVDPQHLVPGMTINILAATPAAPVAPTQPDESKITVRKGDSLWRIAQIKLGFGGFWGCIAKANPVIVDANLIYTGQTLNLPKSCEGAREK